MGQRQRGGDGGAAGSRGATVPTSPCPRGAAKLRGGDVPGPASPLAHKPRASSKELLLLWGDHKTGACRVLSPCPEPARSGCGVRRRAGGQLPSQRCGIPACSNGSTRPRGDPQHRGAQGEVSWGPWDPLGAMESPWGCGIPFLGPWVVVFLGSQPRCSQRRAGAAPAPDPTAMLRIWGDPQEGLCTHRKGPRGCRGGRRGSGATLVGGAGGERGPPGAGRAALPGPCSRSHGAAHHSASSESYLRSWRISLIASMVLISLRERMETINKAHMERIIWAASRSPRCL